MHLAVLLSVLAVASTQYTGETYASGPTPTNDDGCPSGTMPMTQAQCDALAATVLDGH